MIFFNTPLHDFLLMSAADIRDALEHKISEYFGQAPSDEEKRSWEGTVSVLQTLFRDSGLPGDMGVALEYNLPTRNERVDCILTGKDAEDQAHAVLVEMKGWGSATARQAPGKVITRLQGEDREVSHPSKQVKWYADSLSTTQKAVWEGSVMIHPCALLHNCVSRDVIHAPAYSVYTEAAPAFCRGEEREFLDFVRGFIRTGDNGQALTDIDTSRRDLSNTLAEALRALMGRKEFFPLSDEQTACVENIENAVEYQEANGGKIVLVVTGNPGTGKSLVAMKSLFSLSLRTDGRNYKYITKTRAPKAFITNTLNDAHLDNLDTYLSYSGNRALYRSPIHAALVDEAHRLDGSAFNQVDEIVRISDVSVFFMDPRQVVSVADIGTMDNITACARAHQAILRQYQLTVNFRVSVTASIEHLLQYPGSEAVPLPPIEEYDFRIFDDAMEMYGALQKREQEGRSARMVAGYTRRWQSRDGRNVMDWTLAECPAFRFQWNMIETDNEHNWATRQGLDRIGCIHSCQGMEFDYVGVIISHDISVGEDGTLEFHPEKHAADDTAIGRDNCRPLAELTPRMAAKIPELLRNTYFVLLTRGMKGCYVYIEGRADDPAVRRTREYFKRFEKTRRKR